VKKLMRKGKTSWKQTNIDITFDYCQFAQGLKVPLVDVFSPGIRQIFETTSLNCPLQGGFYIQNHTVVAKNLPTFSQVGTEIRTDVIISNEKLVAFFNCYIYSKVIGG
jgi:Protein of unknown function (DUF1091)